MICSRNNGDEDERGVAYTKEDVKEGPYFVHSPLARLKFPSEDAGVVYEGATNDKGIAKMH